jgi:hypothetical protein
MIFLLDLQNQLSAETADHLQLGRSPLHLDDLVAA